MKKIMSFMSFAALTTLMFFFSTFASADSSNSASYLVTLQDPPEFTSFADVNGDGKSDLIFRTYDNRIMVSLSAGNGFAEPALWMTHGRPFLGGMAQFADFNSDGKADLMFQSASNKFWLSLSTGKLFTPPVQVMEVAGNQTYLQGQAQYAAIAKAAASTAIVPGLMFQAPDGTGKTDFFWYAPTLTSAGVVSFAQPMTAVREGDGDFVPGQAQYADLNGDKYSDLIYQNGSNNFYVNLGGANGFTTVNQNWSTNAVWSKVYDAELEHLQKRDPATGQYRYCPGASTPVKCDSKFAFGQVQYADVDGDGLADMLYQDCHNWIYASRSNGKSFLTPEVWAVNCDAYKPGYVMYANIEGDGSHALVEAEAKSLRISPSTCKHKLGDADKPCPVTPDATGFAGNRLSQYLAYPAGLTRSDLTPGRFWHADFNGDKKEDIAIQTVDGQIFVSLSGLCAGLNCSFVQWTTNSYLSKWAALPVQRTGDDHVSLVGFYSHEYFLHADNNMFAGANAANAVFVWDYSKDISSYIKVLQSRIATNALMGFKTIVEVQTVFFGDDSFGPSAGCRMIECHWPLRSNFQSRWDLFAAALTPYLANIGGIYLYDEPLYWLEDYAEPATDTRYPSHPWYPQLAKNGFAGRQTAYAYLKKAADAVKKTFPTLPVIVVENQPKAESIVNDPRDPSFPASFDLVGFDCYTNDFVGCGGPAIVSGLEQRFTGTQKIIIVPPLTYGPNTSSDGNFCQPLPSNQTNLLKNSASWYNYAMSDPQVGAVLPWTAHSDLSPPLPNGTCANIWGGLDDKWGSLNNSGPKSSFLRFANLLLENPGGAYTYGGKVTRVVNSTAKSPFIRFNADYSLSLNPTFINEGGSASAGIFTGVLPTNGTLVATSWGNLKGTIVVGGAKTSINWANNSSWDQWSGSAPNINGMWKTSKDSLGGTGKVIQGGARLKFVNEFGNASTGAFVTGDRVVAFDWGNLIGTIANNGLQINWSNGSAWKR